MNWFEINLNLAKTKKGVERFYDKIPYTKLSLGLSKYILNIWILWHISYQQYVNYFYCGTTN